MRLASRIAPIEDSPTLAITARAKAMRQAGIDVVSFGAGEPDFPTPAHIRRAASEAMEAGFTRYTPAAGIPELREAVARRLEARHAIPYRTEEVIITCGGKHALYNLAQVLLDPGDEVVVITPHWVSYPPIVRMAGGIPVFLPTSEAEGFQIDPRALRRCLTPKTRAVILNAPANPTGTVYAAETLGAIAQELHDYKDVVVISDDIYVELSYVGEVPSILRIAPSLRERTVVVGGASKAYAMTGWRIGFAAGPVEIIAAMKRLQSHSTSNPTSFAQKGALAAFTGPQDVVVEMREAFEARRRVMLDRLAAIPGISCVPPDGAFYAFPNVSAIFGAETARGTIAGSLDLAAYLLEEARLAVIPGIAFGADRYIRLSFATSLSEITRGLERLEAAFRKLR
ncbi:MAG: pyridoxal phosphate-dependent aminotransferase [Deltaproteobacteria bacterium]|nr:MAG: pyridoxal phosphate-dependent aminotransferase [Deltaproteobacteria bacterium]